MFLQRAITFIILCLLWVSCVEVYDVNYRFNAEVITVDGFVTNGYGLTVTLKTARSEKATYYSVPLRNCEVEVRVGDGSVVKLTEYESGVYMAPATFNGQVGQTYQLHFRTPTGKVYESEKEQLRASPEIDKVYHKYNRDGILDRTGKRVAFSSLDVYVDFKDPANERNFYLWRWTDYEEQGLCATCEGGKLDSKTFVCIPERNSRTIYDYRCDAPCWEIFYSNEITVFSDIYSNGRQVQAQQVAKIPFYVMGGGFANRAALVEIQQLAISPNAYEYYKLLRDQAQNTGNLTDTPPSAIIGNVRNIDDSTEEVVGYFGTAGVAKSRHFIDKRPYSNAYKYLMLGREPSLEPDTPPMPPLFESRPPLAPCVQSATRTPIRPAGWLL